MEKEQEMNNGLDLLPKLDMMKSEVAMDTATKMMKPETSEAEVVMKTATNTNLLIHNKYLRVKMNSIRDKRLYQDLEFKLSDGSSVWAHRAIVCEFSSYVAQLCSSDSETLFTSVDLSGQVDDTLKFTPSIINFALDYMYGKDVTLSNKDAVKCSRLAVKLNIPELLSAIDSSLVENGMPRDDIPTDDVYDELTEPSTYNIKQEPNDTAYTSNDMYDDYLVPQETDFDNDINPTEKKNKTGRKKRKADEDDDWTPGQKYKADKTQKKTPKKKQEVIDYDDDETDEYEDDSMVDDIEDPDFVIDREIEKSHEKKPGGRFKKKYKKRCTDCEKSFSSRPELIEHKKIKHQKYCCINCKVPPFDSQELLDEHLTQHERGMKFKFKSQKQTGIYKCQRGCGKKFMTQDEFNKHVEEEHGCNVCPICNNARFKTQEELERHIVIHKGNHVCKRCNDHFDTRVMLGKHKEEKHGMFACDICGTACKTPGDVAHHKIQHEGPHVYITVNEVDEMVYHCDTCTDTFSNKFHFAKHMRDHHGDNPYRCNQCEQRLRSLYHWSQHMMRHRGENHYECKTCGKKLRTLGGLVQHEEQIHSGVRKFMCQLCGKRFGKLDHLTLHESRHSNTKSHKCSICGKGFQHKSLITRHMWNTHKHSFMCQSCGARFSQKEHLKTHERIHTGEKPYRCIVCGKGFTQSASLQCHNKTCSIPEDT